MKLTRVKQHDRHPVEVVLNTGAGEHYAQLRCIKCCQVVQWLKRDAAHKLIDLGVDWRKDSFKDHKPKVSRSATRPHVKSQKRKNGSVRHLTGAR